MTGIFGDMFVLNKDGKMNGFEHAMELTYLKEMKDVYISVMSRKK